MIRDIRYAVRSLAATRGFTTIAVVTLAVTIAAVVAVSAVVYGVLLRPLGYPDADRIIIVKETQFPQFPEFAVSAPNFIDWQKRTRSFSHLAAYARTNLNLSGKGEPQRLIALKVTAEYFQVYGIKPALGRTFAPEDDTAGKSDVVVLSYNLWQREFGGNKDVVGSAIQLDNQGFIVVGVAPRGFGVEEETDAWVPMAFRPDELSDNNRSAHRLAVRGRLHANATVEQARAELELIAAQLTEQYPSSNKGWGVFVMSFFEYSVRGIRSVLYILLAAVGCVFCIGCVNVSNLLLTRAIVRSKETAIRIALGASRGQVIRQFFAESVLLAVFGGVGGVLLSRLVLKWVLSLAPSSLPHASDIYIDGRLVAFCLALTLLAGLAFGLAPALIGARVNLGGLLGQTMRGSSTGGAANRLRKSFVVVQVAFASVLLTMAGLLVEGFVRITHIEPGFKAADATMLRVLLPERQYAEPHRRIAFADELLSRIRALPGVEAVGIAQTIPLYQGWVFAFTVEGRPPMAPSEMPNAYYFSVTPDYFRALGIRLLRGRVFTEADTVAAPRVAIINDALARQQMPGQNPIGKRIKIATDVDAWREVVGVVQDVRETAINKPGSSQIYEAYAQYPFRSLHVIVRSPKPTSALHPALRAAVYAIDKVQPVAELRGLNDVVSETLGRERFAMTIVTFLSAAAVLLATVGIYGVISYVSAQRTGEFAIRIALGARKSDIVRLVLTQGAKLIGLGLLIGLAATAICSRALASMLPSPVELDVFVAAFVSIFLFMVALAACFAPARRATTLDPMEALRNG